MYSKVTLDIAFIDTDFPIVYSNTKYTSKEPWQEHHSLPILQMQQKLALSHEFTRNTTSKQLKKPEELIPFTRSFIFESKERTLQLAQSIETWQLSIDDIVYLISIPQPELWTVLINHLEKYPFTEIILYLQILVQSLSCNIKHALVTKMVLKYTYY